jgi:hypothetical protein
MISAFGVAVPALDKDSIIVQITVVPQNIFLQTTKNLIMLTVANKVL